MLKTDPSMQRQAATHSRPSYLTVLVMAGLLVLAHVLAASEGERRLMDVVIVLTFYGWVAVRLPGKE